MSDGQSSPERGGGPPKAVEGACPDGDYRTPPSARSALPPPRSGEDLHPLSLTAAFASIADHWRPRVAGTANGQDVRLVKTKGTFPWHAHADADEVFLCWRGAFRVEFRDRAVTLGPGEMLVVPRGTEHRTASDEEAEVLIFEPSEVVNTGDAAPSTFTAERRALA